MYTLLRLPGAIAHYTLGSVLLLGHFATFGLATRRVG